MLRLTDASVAQLLILVMLPVFSYRLRIEALLLKEEFNQTVDWLKPSIDSVIISARGSSVKFYFSFLLNGPALHDAVLLIFLGRNCQ